MWDIPYVKNIDKDHQNTINGQKIDILGTKIKYAEFAKSLIERIDMLGA